AWFVALAVIGEAIALTLTRAGLISMAASLVLVGAIRGSRRGADAGTRLVAGLAATVALLFVTSRSPQSMWLRLTSEGQESWYRASVDAPAELEIPAGRARLMRITLAN